MTCFVLRISEFASLKPKSDGFFSCPWATAGSLRPTLTHQRLL